MFRRQSLPVIALVGGRTKHTSSQAATLAPVPGHSAGMQNMFGEVSAAGLTAEEQRRRPILRNEVKPSKDEWNSLATMHKWGTKSLALYRRANEDPGQWYLADSSSFVSAHTTISASVAGGMWSGISLTTHGLTEANKRPITYLGRGIGRKDKSGAVLVDYAESSEMRKTEPQLFMIPHTKEHAMHQRIKNPALPKAKEIENIHYRRLLREVQYHLGNGLRYYMVDGIFGNHTETATPYRIFTDNADHAYIASISACRKMGIVADDEIELVKRAGSSALEEYAWRRPGVLVYHCPSYDFEAPRIVEEFGGPRPVDLGVKHQKFVVLDPYSIPMKAVMGGVLEGEELLKTTALLCARWGFYADDKKFITLNADSIVSKDGKFLTVVIGEGSDAVRSSEYLHSTRHIRVGDNVVSRCWDSESLSSTSAKTRTGDLVEVDTKHVFRPSTTRYGNPKAVSHRVLGSRKPRAYKLNEHVYTNEPATRAAAGGHLLGTSESNCDPIRAAAFRLEETKFVLLGAKGALTAESAAKTIVANLSKQGALYAEEDTLISAIAEMLGKSKGVSGDDNLSKIAKGE